LGLYYREGEVQLAVAKAIPSHLKHRGDGGNVSGGFPRGSGRWQLYLYGVVR